VRVTGIAGTLDVGTLEVGTATEIALNDIGLVHLATAEPIVVDDYRDNRVTGSFILIDEVTNATVAAGMIGHANFL
jgi:bifunctional enzyme CysN/CysC